MTEHTTRDSTNEIPYGYCHCGCGQKTQIAPYSSKRIGWTKGKPLKYIKGHNFRTSIKRREPNPSGLCMCGCGQKTELAPQNRASRDWVKGKPKRFIQGHNNAIRQSLQEHFWSRVLTGEKDACWEWQGSTHSAGYGEFQHRNTKYSAHRLSWEIHNGPIPDDMYVCHHCDNPPCVNPRHLFLGTLQDNHNDMVQKSRQVRGERQHNAKLTDVDVREIRHLYESGVSRAEIARRFGISASHVWHIAKRKAWRHIE